MTKNNDKLDQILENQNRRFDDVTNTLDKVLGEIEKVREDKVFAQAKDREQDKRIDNLDNRVKVLESTHA
ncbi:hypothetical protein ACFL5U_01870 [Candidatus Margulisiibacteriota bacterium]